MKVIDPGDRTIKYGGRTAIITVYLNTAATQEAITKRFAKLQKSKSLRGSKLDMVIMTLEVVEDGSEFWDEARTTIDGALKGPNKS